MNEILAKVVNVDRVGNEYLITVRVGYEKHESAFERLIFGEIKPHVGWYRYGWLDLVYHQNPGLKAGQSFPLWKDSETSPSFAINQGTSLGGTFGNWQDQISGSGLG
jgi:hypothetical protein